MLDMRIKHHIFAISPNPPYTTYHPYSPYEHGRSNGWSFLTFTNLRPCTVSENPLTIEWNVVLGVGLLGAPGKCAQSALYHK